MINLEQWGHGLRLQHEIACSRSPAQRQRKSRIACSSVHPSGTAAEVSAALNFVIQRGSGPERPVPASRGTEVERGSAVLFPAHDPLDVILSTAGAVLELDQKSGVCLRGKGRPKCS